MPRIRLSEQTLKGLGFRLLPCVTLLVTLASCGHASPASVQVKRLAPEVWAGVPAVLPPLVESDEWMDLGASGAVKTDTEGEASIRIPGCTEPLFVAGDSHVQLVSCRENGGSDTPTPCARKGTLYFSGTCAGTLAVDTYSARVSSAGATFSVSYVPLRRLSLIIVFEGEVAVQPVLDFDSGELASAVTVPAGTFLHVMPGQHPVPVRNIPGREPRPMSELQTLTKSLFIEPMIEHIGQRAADDGLLPDPWPATDNPGRKPPYLVLLSAGGPLQNPDVQSALLPAIRRSVQDQSSARYGFLAEIGGAIIDVETTSYDPADSRARLADAGYASGFAAELLFAYSWQLRGLWEVGEDIVADLRSAGLDVVLLTFGEAQIYEEIQQRIEADLPVLWLEIW